MKKITYLILFIITILLCNGCSRKFELKEDTITLELGESLSEDLSEYIISNSYKNITVDTSNLHNVPVNSTLIPKENSGYVLFSNSEGKTLEMTVIYKDTTPPVLEDCEDLYLYTIGTLRRSIKDKDNPFNDFYKLNEVHEGHIENIIGELILEVDRADELRTNYSFSHSFCTSLIIDNQSINLDLPIWSEEYTFPIGDYPMTLTLEDDCGNRATFDMTLHIVKDISPEQRNLIKECGYTDQQIDDYIANLK